MSQHKLLIVDAHQDLAYNAVTLGRDYRRSALETRAREKSERVRAGGGNCMIGLPELLAGRVAIVFGTIFTMPAHRAMFRHDIVYDDAQAAHTQAMTQLDVYHRWADEEAQIALVGSGIFSRERSPRPEHRPPQTARDWLPGSGV